MFYYSENLLHQQFQQLIASKQFDEVYRLGIDITPKYPFLAQVYVIYLDLMLGKLKNVKDRLEAVEKLELEDELDSNIRQILYAYYNFRIGSLGEANTYLISSENFFSAFSPIPNEIGFWVQIRHVIRGGITTRSGDYIQSKEQFKKSLEWAIKLNIGNQIVQAHNNFGYANLLLGRLDDAFHQFQLAIDYIKTNNLDSFMYYPISNIGIFYFLKGDLSNSEVYHRQGLSLARENMNDVQIASQYRDLGLLEKKKGNFETSLDYLQKALQLHVQIGNNIWTSNTLLHLIELSQVLNHQSLAEAYYAHLLSLGQDTQNSMISELMQFGMALIMKDKPKIREKVMATEIFKRLSHSESMDRDTRIRAMLYHSELLLMEYKMTESPEIVTEINEIISELSKFAEENHSLSMQVEALCLRAQLSLVSKQYEIGLNMFLEAMKVAQENDLKYSQIQIERRLITFKEHARMLKDEINSDIFRKKFIGDYLSAYILEVLQIKKEFKEHQ